MTSQILASWFAWHWRTINSGRSLLVAWLWVRR